MHSTVRFEAKAYAAAARDFSLRLLVPLLHALHQQGAIVLPAKGDLSEADLSKVYEIGFLLFAQLEDHGGFPHGGGTLFASLLFSPTLPVSPEGHALLGTTESTALHGDLDEDLIRLATARAVAK